MAKFPLNTAIPNILASTAKPIHQLNPSANKGGGRIGRLNSSENRIGTREIAAAVSSQIENWSSAHLGDSIARWGINHTIPKRSRPSWGGFISNWEFIASEIENCPLPRLGGGPKRYRHAEACSGSLFLHTKPPKTRIDFSLYFIACLWGSYVFCFLLSCRMFVSFSPPHLRCVILCDIGICLDYCFVCYFLGLFPVLRCAFLFVVYNFWIIFLYMLF